MVTRNELKKLAHTRLKEARILFNNDLYDGCFYIAGYTAELALKARICRLLDLDQYPDSGELGKVYKTHKLLNLLQLAGLEKTFENATSQNPQLMANWSLLSKNWSEKKRYKPIGTSQKQNAQEILNALNSRNHGVFTWIKRYW